MTSTSPIALIACIAALAVGATAVGPAAAGARSTDQPVASASAKKKQPKPKRKLKPLDIGVGADPLAPAGETPKVLFQVKHAVKGRQYRLMAHLVRGDDPETCTGSLGDTGLHTSPVNGIFPFDRTPWDVASANNGYDILRGDVCQGVYEGELEERDVRGVNTHRVLDFVLTVPGLALDVVDRRP